MSEAKKKKLSIREKAARDREIVKEQKESEELKAQATLFDLDEDWKKLWKGMPRFQQEDLQPLQTVLVHFKSIEDRRMFSNVCGQTITDLTKSIWYPKADIGRIANKRYVSESGLNPRYPVYIISKGRWENPLTAKSLEYLNVPYHIVVEPQEVDKYAGVIDPSKILALPFSNLGQGSIPARNWVWEHSISIGAERHWILDDNINHFYRLTDNLKIKVTSGDIFRAAEDFSDRYENVAISGFNYFMFAPRKVKMLPMTLNTRIYSMILIRNDLPYRWRGRYNEDTDLSLRALKDGWCTVLFNAFLGMKTTTMKMKGGNTDELYKQNSEMDGRLLMAESLKEQHPDVVTVTRKWGRWQHHVDYTPFKKNKLILKPDVSIPDGDDNYGMKLVEIAQEDSDELYPTEEDGDEIQEAMSLPPPRKFAAPPPRKIATLTPPPRRVVVD